MYPDECFTLPFPLLALPKTPARIVFKFIEDKVFVVLG